MHNVSKCLENFSKKLMTSGRDSNPGPLAFHWNNRISQLWYQNETREVPGSNPARCSSTFSEIIWCQMSVCYMYMYNLHMAFYIAYDIIFNFNLSNNFEVIVFF